MPGRKEGRKEGRKTYRIVLNIDDAIRKLDIIRLSYYPAARIYRKGDDLLLYFLPSLPSTILKKQKKTYERNPCADKLITVRPIRPGFTSEDFYKLLPPPEEEEEAPPVSTTSYV